MRSRKRAIVVLALLVSLTFTIHPVRSDPKEGFRTWTTQSGRSIEAGFGGVDRVEKKVKLDLGNGEEILYPLHRLSEKDRRWVDESSPLLPGDHSRVLDQIIAKRAATSAENSPLVSRWLELQGLLKEDSAFVVWIYGQLLGRVPEAEEVADFMKETDPAKRTNLIDALMSSREFDQHFVGVFLADLLQVNGKLPEIPAFADCPEPTAENQKKRRPNPAPELYEQWVTDQVVMDRPRNEMVKEVYPQYRQPALEACFRDSSDRTGLQSAGPPCRTWE